MSPNSFDDAMPCTIFADDCAPYSFDTSRRYQPLATLLILEMISITFMIDKVQNFDFVCFRADLPQEQMVQIPLLLAKPEWRRSPTSQRYTVTILNKLNRPH